MIANLLRLPNSGPAPPPGLTGAIYLLTIVCCCRAADKYLGKTLRLDTSRFLEKSTKSSDNYENLTEEEVNRRIEEEISNMTTEELEQELKRHEEEFPLSEPIEQRKQTTKKIQNEKKNEEDNDNEDEDDDEDVDEDEDEEVDVPAKKFEKNITIHNDSRSSTVDQETYRALKASFESSSFVKPWLEHEALRQKRR
jgi:hypothetical protein